MINVKKLFANILESLISKVDKAGDTLTGDLTIDKDGDTSRYRAISRDNGTIAASCMLASNTIGSSGVYDNLHSKWIARTDANGKHHIPITPTLISSIKIALRSTSVGTPLMYTSIPGIADWSIITIRFTVAECSQMITFYRGESVERIISDNPSAGRFRGGIAVNWNDSTVGIRCITAPVNKADLVYIDRIYGVM